MPEYDGAAQIEQMQAKKVTRILLRIPPDSEYPETFKRTPSGPPRAPRTPQSAQDVPKRIPKRPHKNFKKGPEVDR